MPLEIANYINELNENWPIGATDERRTADDHLRVIKNALKSTFPFLTGRFQRSVSLSANYTIQTTDNSVVFGTDAAITVTLPTPALVGNGWSVIVSAHNGDVSFVGTVNNTTNFVLKNNYVAILFCNGTNYMALLVPRALSDFIYSFLATSTPAEGRTALGLGSLAVKNLVDVGDYTPGSVGSTALASGAITNDKIAANTIIGSAKIAPASITSAELSAGVIGAIGFGRTEIVTAGNRRWGPYATTLFKRSDGNYYGFGYRSMLGLNLNDMPSETPLSSSGVKFTKLIATSQNIYGISEAADLYALGANSVGQLGQGDTTARYIMTRVDWFRTGGRNIDVVDVFVTAGLEYTTPTVYVLGGNGTLYSFGNNLGGLTGQNLGSTGYIATPGVVVGLTNVIGVSPGTTGYGTTFAWTATNLYAWGSNIDGSAGLGDSIYRDIPAVVTIGGSPVTNVQKILNNVKTNLHSFTVLLRTNGTVYTCGKNVVYQLGVGDTTSRNIFTQVPGIGIIVDFDMHGAWYGSVAARTDSGDLWCWGYNVDGRFGNSTTVTIQTPTIVHTNVTDVVFGGDYANVTMHMNKNNRWYGSGYGGWYGLGTGSSAAVVSTPEPVLLPAGVTVAQFAIGYSDDGIRSTPLILLTDGRLLRGGRNAYGELGNGSVSSGTTPGLVIHQ